MPGLETIRAFPAAVHLVGGQWSGSLLLDGFAAEAVLLAEDTAGRRGVSGPFQMTTSDDLAVRFDPTGSLITAGTTFTHRIVVTNASDRPSSEVWLRVDPDSRLSPGQLTSLTASQGTATVLTNGTTLAIEASLGTLQPGGWAQLEVAFDAPPPDPAALAQTWVTRATVGRAEPEANLANNEAIERREFAQLAVDVDSATLAIGLGGDPEVGRCHACHVGASVGGHSRSGRAPPARFRNRPGCGTMDGWRGSVSTLGRQNGPLTGEFVRSPQGWRSG